jgi:SNF family Na+-dependent transporter
MTNEQFGPAVNTAAYGDEVRRVGGRGIIAITGFVLFLAAYGFVVWSGWHSYNLATDVVYGEAQVTLDDLERADRIATAAGWLLLGAIALSATTFLIWLWRARKNAEAMCDATHRRTRGWVVWSWIVPVVSLWFPYQIVQDVHRASRPDTPHDLYELGTVRRSGLIAGWWAIWLGTTILGYYVRLFLRGDPTLDQFHQIAVIGTVGIMAAACAGVLLAITVRQISAWQDAKVINVG